LTITFRADDIHILLKDKGLGIPKDEMNLMFTSFFRAKNIVNLNIPGNGLGLVISKKIVDLHKGTIQLRSEENVGTEVEIILPNLTIE
jgi:signal transduction histidine kinase